MKYISRLLGIVVLTATFASCNSDNFDNAFDESASERLELRKKELRSALLSSDDGWKMTYFTDDEVLGGFTHLIKFKDEKFATMISDFDKTNVSTTKISTLIPKTEEYDVVLGSTVSLSFVLGTHIHRLSDNSEFPSTAFRGKGYKGSSQFLFQSYDGEVINFKANRNDAKIVFERATAKDWTELAKNFDMMDIVRTMRKIYVKGNQGLDAYNFVYGGKTRFASVLTADKTQSVNENGGIGIGFTPTGIIVSPAIELEDGTVISKLEFSAASGTFESADGKIIITK